MTRELHKSHFGMEKTKKWARKILYWPGIITDIENFISSCRICEKFSRNKIKEPLIPHEVPKYPFEIVGSDILEYASKYYLVVVDYYSNWIELKEIQRKSIDEILKQLKVIFSNFGLPAKFISDNNPYNSFKFKEFCNQYNIQCVFTSPRYPKSNGLAEKAVHICKQLLKKCNNEDEIFVHLLNYRVTPLCGLEASPSELLQSRLLRTGLPISNKLLEPKTTNEYGKKVERKLAVKSYHDKSARSSSDFNENQDILFKLKKDGYWTPGKVLSNTNTPRSYLVSDENGRVYKRNSSFLKNTKNPTVINAPNNNENININCKPNSADESSENTCLSNRTDVYNENGCGTNNNKTANECTSVKEANSKCTRSGRVVNVPNRLRDYYT
ncbi:uncharacterized protein K02A2.6-like [Diorhabda sublineata]|uniref:uncharacterized protein K02A2.6-like n=1 Tax=Diorhabda sublineata TaxID=1163346 RepID=UPI0024E11A78|nr:uncharacterized protein K02A2.6-like [Diorhabda sublineata]